jgi:hypothetical protein
MSRFSAPAANGGSIAFGLDRALGFFAQLFNAEGVEVEAIDMYNPFTPAASGSEVWQFCAERVCPDRASDLDRNRISMIALDLDPELA